MRTPDHFSRACTSSPVSYLAVSSKDSDRLSLKTLTADVRWDFHEARSIAEALETVSHHSIGVIITDCDLPDGSWTDLLERLRPGCNPPRIIVFSSVADDRFWAEVLNIGGYDVLATPFNRIEVIRAAHVAWLSWSRTGRVTPSQVIDDVAIPTPIRWSTAAGR